MQRFCLAIGLFVFAIAGCNTGSNNDLNYKTAINDHFKAFPECIWSQPKKFPVQAATSDDAKTEGYDALTQEGLLNRTTAEKKVIIVSKQVNDYDLSDKGGMSWTPDTAQPGYGNFCYGNREVTSIDNSTLGTDGQGAKTVDVAYHYKISSVAPWATSQEMSTAYPNISAALRVNAPDNATLSYDWQSLGIQEVGDMTQTQSSKAKPSPESKVPDAEEETKDSKTKQNSPQTGPETKGCATSFIMQERGEVGGSCGEAQKETKEKYVQPNKEKEAGGEG